jgi:hypothetical protein
VTLGFHRLFMRALSGPRVTVPVRLPRGQNGVKLM